MRGSVSVPTRQRAAGDPGATEPAPDLRDAWPDAPAPAAAALKRAMSRDPAERPAEGGLEQRRRRNLAREVFQVASARARRRIEQAVQGDAELRRLLDEVQERKLDPLSAVREILQKVFHIDDEDHAHTR